MVVSVRLWWPLGKNSHRVGADERVALEHALDPLADDLRGEQFGERGGDRLEQRLVANEMDVSLDRKARARQEPGKRNHIVALEPEPVSQLEPARDATVALGLAVVIDEPAAPFPPQRRIVAARDQAR